MSFVRKASTAVVLVCFTELLVPAHAASERTMTCGASYEESVTGTTYFTDNKEVRVPGVLQASEKYRLENDDLNFEIVGQFIASNRVENRSENLSMEVKVSRTGQAYSLGSQSLPAGSRFYRMSFGIHGFGSAMIRGVERDIDYAQVDCWVQ